MIARIAFVTTLAVGLCLAPVQARIEQTTVPCDGRLCLWERPDIAAPVGWAFDAKWSPRLRITVFTPAGTGFPDALANMMAQATERTPKTTLAEFMQAEQDRLIGPSLTVTARPIAPLRNGDGIPMPALRIAPREGRSGSTQTLAFAQDGEHFVVLSLNARSAEEHERAWSSFVKFVAGYRVKSAMATTRR